MKLHANHRTCPSSRLFICRRVLEERWTLAQAAEAAGCSERTASKWLKRYRDGDRQLVDRSSRPRHSPTRLPADRVQAIEALRRLWMTAAQIAEVLGLPLSTVSLWLKRIGLGKRSRLTPPEPPNRYERRHPGETEELAIGVEAPGTALVLDLECGLIRAVEELVVDFAGVVAVGERKRLRAVPLDLHNRDRPIRQNAAHTSAWSQVLEADGGARFQLIRISRQHRSP